MRKLWLQWVKTARLMVGVYDYDTYVVSRRRFNPQAPVMTEVEFFRYCQNARYAGKTMKKCPC